MNAARTKKIFYFFAATLVVASCSLYQSDGRKAIEKNSNGIVTSSGFHLALNVKYECVAIMALPADWQTDVTSLDEFTQAVDINAVLLNQKEIPTVVTYSWSERHVAGCSLEILDSKLSSHRLSEVVTFGEHLLTQTR